MRYWLLVFATLACVVPTTASSHVIQAVSAAETRDSGELSPRNINDHLTYKDNNHAPYLDVNAADGISVIQAFVHRGDATPTAAHIREQRDCAIRGMSDGGQPADEQELWMFWTESVPRSSVEQAYSQPYQGCTGITETREPAPEPIPEPKPEPTPQPEPIPDPGSALKVLMPETHARLGIPLHVEPTGAATDRVKISVVGPVSKTIHDSQVGTGARRTVRWNMRDLTAGDYTIKSQIIAADGTVRLTQTETFSRDYDGWGVAGSTNRGPKVGYDEHNGVFVNGKPKFFVNGFLAATSQCGGTTEAKAFERNCLDLSAKLGYMNGSQGVGYREIDRQVDRSSPTAWKLHLDDCERVGVGCHIGYVGSDNPDDPDALPKLSESFFKERIDIAKGHPGFSQYIWTEEPDLGHPPAYDGEEIRRPTDISHKYDSQHPVRMLFSGSAFSDSPLKAPGTPGACPNQWGGCSAEGLDYSLCRIEPDNDVCGGYSERKPMSVDMFLLDYYPIDQGGGQYEFDQLYQMIDHMRAFTLDLAPLGAFVEPTNLLSYGGNAGAKPTPAQVWGEVWMTIAAGAREINWFPYGEIAPGVTDVVKRTVDTTTRYAPVLQGADSRAVTATDDVDGRVRYVTRKDPTNPNKLVVFAVNGDIDSMASASFKVDGTVTRVTANEGCDSSGDTCVRRSPQTLAVNGGQFKDSLGPLGVRIYEIALDGGAEPTPEPTPDPEPEPDPVYAPECEPTCGEQIPQLTADLATMTADRDEWKRKAGIWLDKLQRIQTILNE